MAERIPNGVTRRVVLHMVLSSDHITPAPGKTVAVTISKNGASPANPSGGATNATEIGNGDYYVDASVTDAGTNGPLIVYGTASGCDQGRAEFVVVNAHNAGFDALPDIATGTAGAVITNGTGTAQISATAGQVNAENSIWDAVRSGHTAAGTFGGDATDEASFIADMLTAINADVVDGTRTWANVKKLVLAILGGNAVGLQGDLKSFKDQSNNTLASATFSDNGSTRTVVLTF